MWPAVGPGLGAPRDPRVGQAVKRRPLTDALWPFPAPALPRSVLTDTVLASLSLKVRSVGQGKVESGGAFGPLWRPWEGAGSWSGWRVISSRGWDQGLLFFCSPFQRVLAGKVGSRAKVHDGLSGA